MRITDQELVKSILKALSDDKSCLILSRMAFQALSVMDLIRDENLPVSSAYRKISELENEGLIGVERTIITDDGKSYNLYKSTFVEFTIRFEHGNFIVEGTPNKDILDKAFNLFYSFRRTKK